jgi:hypothetical protein
MFGGEFVRCCAKIAPRHPGEVGRHRFSVPHPLPGGVIRISVLRRRVKKTALASFTAGPQILADQLSRSLRVSVLWRQRSVPAKASTAITSVAASC